MLEQEHSSFVEFIHIFDPWKHQKVKSVDLIDTQKLFRFYLFSFFNYWHFCVFWYCWHWVFLICSFDIVWINITHNTLLFYDERKYRFIVLMKIFLWWTGYLVKDLHLIINDYFSRFRKKGKIPSAPLRGLFSLYYSCHFLFFIFGMPIKKE